MNSHDGTGENDKEKKTEIGSMEITNMLCSKWLCFAKYTFKTEIH